MTFKRFGAVLMTILLTISLLSCNQIPETKQSAQEAEPQENNMLSFRITWKDYSGRGQAIQKIVDAYNQSNSDQTDIQLISGDEDMAAIQTMLETD